MRHRCHWPGCPIHVPPKLWGCRPHWYRLPKHIRDAIWKSYRPGQEDDKKPSRAYVAAARAAQKWIASLPKVIQGELEDYIGGLSLDEI